MSWGVVFVLVLLVGVGEGGIVTYRSRSHFWVRKALISSWPRRKVLRLRQMDVGV